MTTVLSDNFFFVGYEIAALHFISPPAMLFIATFIAVTI